MIVEVICNLLFGAFNFLISLIPSMDFLKIPSEIYDTFNYLCKLSGYFLPMNHIGIIFGMWLIFTNYRLIYAIVMRVWDALPFT